MARDQRRRQRVRREAQRAAASHATRPRAPRGRALPLRSTPRGDWLRLVAARYLLVNLLTFAAMLASHWTAFVVPWFGLPVVGLSVDQLFETPDGRMFIYSRLYRGLQEFDKEGHFVCTHADPVADVDARGADWAVASDGRIFASFSVSGEGSWLREYDGDLRLVTTHAEPREGAPALDANGNVAFVPWKLGMSAPPRAVRPGELLFPRPDTVRTRSFECGDGGRLEREWLGQRRTAPDGTSRRFGPCWFWAFVTPPIGFILAGVVFTVVRANLGITPNEMWAPARYP